MPEPIEFFEAIREGNTPRVKAALDAAPDLVRANPDTSFMRDGVGRATPLHLAVQADQREVVQVLLDAGADIEARNECGRTPLHDALEYNNSLRDLLISRGARVDICSAAFLGRLDRIEELLARTPALVDDRSTRLTPLGWAAYACQLGAARKLIARGARMDGGELLCAASVGCLPVGRLLLDHGVDPDAMNESWGSTALHAAAAMRHAADATTFVAMLLRAGADVHLRTRCGRTALEIALAGAEREARENPGRETARLCAYQSVAALLKAAGA